MTPTAFGTSPKFDNNVLVGKKAFYVEFGGGWEGAEGHYEELCC
jgi:hypothetical protein